MDQLVPSSGADRLAKKARFARLQPKEGAMMPDEMEQRKSTPASMAKAGASVLEWLSPVAVLRRLFAASGASKCARARSHAPARARTPARARARPHARPHDRARLALAIARTLRGGAAAGGWSTTA